MPEHNFKNNGLANALWSECPPDRNDLRPYWYWDGLSEMPELTTHAMRQNTTRSGLWKGLPIPHAPNATLIVSPDTYWIARTDINNELLRQALQIVIQEWTTNPANPESSMWITDTSVFINTCAFYSPFTQALSALLNLPAEQKTQLAFDWVDALRTAKISGPSRSFKACVPAISPRTLQTLQEIDIEQIWPDAKTRPAQTMRLEDLDYLISQWLKHHGPSMQPLPVRLSVLRKPAAKPVGLLDPDQPVLIDQVVLTIDHENPSFLLLPASSRSDQ